MRQPLSHPVPRQHSRPIKLESLGGTSVQFSCSVVSDSLQPHELQHARPPRPSPTPRIFLENDEGQISELTNEPVYRRAQMGVGYLAQEASVFRRLSVEDNIKAVLEMTDYSKEYQRERVEALIEEFRLQKVRKSLGIQLSGGERRRTEIARAVAINPSFILLDEPFAGVDPIAVEDIQSIVATLKNKNIGVIITDHNVDETLEITDRTYLLYEGKILKTGDRKSVV